MEQGERERGRERKINSVFERDIKRVRGRQREKRDREGERGR